MWLPGIPLRAKDRALCFGDWGDLGEALQSQEKHYEPFLVTEAPGLRKKLRVHKGAQADR
jgi:hypothetical protein